MARLKKLFSGLMFGAALSASVGLSGQALAQPVQIHTEYKVTVIGLPIASAKFLTTVDGKAFSIAGNLRSSALSDLFAKTRGTARVSGQVAKDRLLASEFLVDYISGREKHHTYIKFTNGNARSVTVEPKSDTTASDWVPLLKRDMRAVLDPLSGMVFPAGKAVCPRSLPMFDGEGRATLHLSPKGIRPFRTKGFKGDAVVCTVRFEPNSGYGKNSSGIKFLRKVKGIEVWFGKHDNVGLYAPVYAKIPTEIGPVIVYATRFGG